MRELSIREQEALDAAVQEVYAKYDATVERLKQELEEAVVTTREDALSRAAFAAGAREGLRAGIARMTPLCHAMTCNRVADKILAGPDGPEPLEE